MYMFAQFMLSLAGGTVFMRLGFSNDEYNTISVKYKVLNTTQISLLVNPLNTGAKKTRVNIRKTFYTENVITPDACNYICTDFKPFS